MLHHQPLFPLVLASPPSSTPSTPPLPGSLIPSPTPPRSDPPSPSYLPHSKTQHFTTFGAAGETFEGGKEGGELTLGAQEAPEASSSKEDARTRWEDSHEAARWTSLSSKHESEPLLHPAPQHHPRLSSFSNPLPWESSPTSSMSTLSRLEESSQTRTGDTSPPSGVDDEHDPKRDAVNDVDLMVRLDEFGGRWEGGADQWRLGVGFGGRRDERMGSDADLKLPDSRTYAAHVVSADSSSGEPSPSSPHRPLPSHIPLGYSLPTELLSPISPTGDISPHPHMSPFPSFENLTTPSSPVRPNASPYLRTTSSRTTTTTTTTRTHVRGHSLSMPTSPPQRATEATGDGQERARTKSGFSTGTTNRGARPASVRSWHSDEEEDEDEEESYSRPRRERVASETPVGSDATNRGGSGPPRRHASSLRSSPAQPRGELPFQSSSNSFNKSARVTSFQTPHDLPSRSSPHPGRSTLHRARSSSSSHAGLSAFGFAFPALFPSQEQEGFDNIATPSPTPAIGGERRRKTTKSAPSSRVNLAAMFKAAGASSNVEGGRASGGKGGGIFGLVKDGIQALHHQHQQASTASSHSSSGVNLSPTSPFASGSHQPSSSSLLSPHSVVSPSRSNSPSPGDSQALTILTRPIYPIAKFATLICISFFALLALSSVLVGSYGLTAWDEGRLRIAGARERVEGGRRMIERGVERAREVVGEVMSGGGISEEPAGDGFGGSREDRDASGEERRRHDGSGGRRSDKRTTEEAFKQLHEAAVTVVRRFLPSSITSLLFNTSSPSTRTRKRSSPHSQSTSSKRHSRKTSTDETTRPRTAPQSRQSSRRPSFSTPFSPSSNNSGDERDDPSARPRRSSNNNNNRTPSPSPTRRGSGHSETRYTFSSNPGSPSTPTGQEPASEKPSSSSSSSGKKRGGGGGSTNGLPPRPPLGVLIPSIFLTIVIAICALVGGFIKGWQGRGNKARR